MRTTNKKPNPGISHQQRAAAPGCATGNTHRNRGRPDPVLCASEVSPPVASLVRKMDAALHRRAAKTTWLSQSVRAQIHSRYAAMLTSESSDLLGFLRWMTCDGRYLAAEGNFVAFCAEYLAANEEEARALWLEASPPA